MAVKSLDASFFVRNREVAAANLQGGLLVVPGYKAMQKTNDEEFRFVQESNMWYLSGIEFPDWWLILDGQTGKSWLVEPTIDDRHRLFTESLAIEDAKKRSGIEHVITRDQAMDMLRRHARTHPLVYTVGHSQYVDYFEFALNPAVTEMRSLLDRIFTKIQDFRPELAKLRAVKQPIELTMMQQSIDLTVTTLQDIKEKLPLYKNEYHIEAELGYGFGMNGGRHGFDPIVASGSNATVAHYFQNNSPLKKGTFVMLDVGANVGGYPADITRTFAYGKPTKRMSMIHDAVRTVQSEIVELIHPGLLVEEYHRLSDEIIKKKMVELGLLSSMADEDGYRRFMPHALSHGLGVDVHDSLGKPKEFLPGMVLTVEPGIYLQNEGIGVRIEDDILVTDNGHKNMSAKLSTAF